MYRLKKIYSEETTEDVVDYPDESDVNDDNTSYGDDSESINYIEETAEEIIKEVPEEKQNSKDEKRITRKKVFTFVNILVVLCLFICATITYFTMYEYHRLNIVMQAGEISALLAIWGGELLLIVIRQVLGSDIAKKKEEHNG